MNEYTIKVSSKVTHPFYRIIELSLVATHKTDEITMAGFFHPFFSKGIVKKYGPFESIWLKLENASKQELLALSVSLI